MRRIKYSKIENFIQYMKKQKKITLSPTEKTSEKKIKE
jgi:hypothetical protein